MSLRLTSKTKGFKPTRAAKPAVPSSAALSATPAATPTTQVPPTILEESIVPHDPLPLIEVEPADTEDRSGLSTLANAAIQELSPEHATPITSDAPIKKNDPLFRASSEEQRSEPEEVQTNSPPVSKPNPKKRQGSQINKGKGSKRKKADKTRNSTSEPADAQEEGEDGQSEGDDAPIDPAAISMARLCALTGKGRLSTKGQAEADAKKAVREEQKKLRKKMKLESEKVERRLRGESVLDSDTDAQGTSPIKQDSQAPSQRPKSGTPSIQAGGQVTSEALGPSMELDDDSHELPVRQNRYHSGEPEPASDSENRPAKEGTAEQGEDDFEFMESGLVPQARIRNGRLVLDETSMQVARDDTDGDAPIVDQQMSDRRVTSATWGKRVKSAKWTPEETERFFDAISQNGSDLAMIALYFPDRSRAQIRAKWKREDKANPDKITQALMSKKDRGNLEELSKKINLDLSGPCPEDPMEKYYLDKPGMPKRDVNTPAPALTAQQARQEAAQARREKKAEQTKQLTKVGSKLQRELLNRGVELEVLEEEED